MKKKKLFCVFYIAGLILLPGFVSYCVNGSSIIEEQKKPDMESLVPEMLKSQISNEYQNAAIEAQAVIARSNFYRKIENKKNIWEIMKILKEEFQDTEVWRIPDKIYRKAAEATKDKVLLADGKLKLVPYHELSAGKTRSGMEIFHDKRYGYLKSVESSIDKSSPEFLSCITISKRQLPEDLKIRKCDSSGYVLSLYGDGNILEGEAFAYGMGLPSSNFFIQKSEDQMRFICQGRGHGLGFSQYGGNELAKEGQTWEEILNTYFPEMEIANYS